MRCLKFIHLGIRAAATQKLIVGSLLRDGPVLQDQDAVRHPNGGKAMRNEDGHFILSQLGETIKDFVFGPRVQRCRRLVENQQLRIAQIGACESHLLPFAAGKVHSARESATKHLIVMPRKLMHNLFCHALEGRGADTERIVPLLNPADGDVFRRGHFISHEVLKDDRDFPPEVIYVIVAQVIAVQKNLP